MSTHVSVNHVDQTSVSELVKLAAICSPTEEIDRDFAWIVCNYHSEYTYTIKVNYQLVGYIFALCNNDTVVIQKFGVLPDTDNGFSTFLFDVVVRIAELQKKNVHCIVNERNAQAMTMLQLYCDAHGKQAVRIKELSDINPISNEHSAYSIKCKGA